MGATYRAVFAGCVRNCAEHLPAVLANIERMAETYAEAAFIFVENDSRDGSKRLLEEWCRNRPHALIITCYGIDAAYPLRTLRLAYLRGQYLAAAKSQFGGYDHLVGLDCDETNAMAIDTGTVRRAMDFLESNPGHAGVFANQRGVYYDLWALRHPLRCPGDVWEEVCDCAFAFRLSDEEAFTRTFAKRIFSLPADAPPLEVQSAFGGLGIYKMSSIAKNRQPHTGYKKKFLPTPDGWVEIGWQCCEHVSFNTGFRELGQKLFVLPYLINRTTLKTGFPPSAFHSLMFDPELLARQVSTKDRA